MLRYRLRRWTAAALTATATAFPASVNASPCAEAINLAAQATGVPHRILHSIATVEAGVSHAGRSFVWPWAINDGGRSLYFRDKAAALGHVRARLEQGATNVDLGCFQINWHWHGERIGDPAVALDPTRNAFYAAAYLRELLSEKGTWAAAVAAYHSRQPDRAAAYQCRVASVLASTRDLPGC